MRMTNRAINAQAQRMKRLRSPTKDGLLIEIETVLGLDRLPPHYQGTIDKAHLARIYLGLMRKLRR
jgi:hypothetical protein